MAKPRTPNQKKRYSELDKRLKQYLMGVDAIYEKHNMEASILASLTDFTGEDDKPFSFDDYPFIKEASDKAVNDFVDDMSALIYSGTSKEWRESNHVQDLLANDVLKAYKAYPNEKTASYYQQNNDQLKAFQERRENGMHLSNKLWKQGKQYRQALEDTISVAIEKGMSAPELAKNVTKYLKDYDKVKANYKKKYGKEPNSVNVQYVTRRLAVTEINMAYRTAEQKRWEQMDFIVGYEIKTQGAHGHEHKADICDMLQGKYPKSFKWVGWHPLCRCIAIPIMSTEDEFFSLEPSESVNEVKDIPDETKQWIEDNASRIRQANKRHKLPYWIRDNYEVKNGKITLVSVGKKPSPVPQPQPQVKTIEQITKERHEARTPEKEQMLREWWAKHKRKDAILRASEDRHQKRDDVAVLRAWNDRKATYKFAEKISNYMDGIPDLMSELNDLEIAMKSGKYDDMLAKAKALKAIGKDIKSFKNIENPMEAVKDYGYNAIKGTNEAVKKKLDSLSWMSLEEQKKQLQKEIIYVEDATYLKPHTIYPTWKVSQNAYKAELAKVTDSIEWNSLKSDFAPLQSFKTKSSIYKELIAKVTQDIADNDLYMAKFHLTKLQEKKAELEASAMKKKLGKLPKDIESVKFTPDNFTKERRDNAMWAKDGMESYKELGHQASDVWVVSPQEERDAIHGYTNSYHNINEPLRGLTYYGNSYSKQLGEDRIPHITSIINKTSLERDMWLQRGGDMVELKKFGLSNYATASDSEIMALLGKEGTDGAFVSAGACKGKGFTGDVMTYIYAPKGTKGMYCEPFSTFGCGSQSPQWNGILSQTDVSYENEILLQRGTTFKITRIRKEGSTWHIDVDIVAQNPLPFPYQGGYPYL